MELFVLSQDLNYFIIIYLENQVVFRIDCKLDKCDSEKRMLHKTVQEGISAGSVDRGFISDKFPFKLSLDYIYSDKKLKLSDQHKMKQLFGILQRTNTCD
ncbi:hypothetical protein pb186bvf_000192 [Paramecium bursaria]